MWFEIPNSCFLRSCVRNLFRFHRDLNFTLPLRNSSHHCHTFQSANNTSERLYFHKLLPNQIVDKIRHLQADIYDFCATSSNKEVNSLLFRTFSTGGKMIRPILVLLMSGLCNALKNQTNSTCITDAQYKIAMIAEMIHTASLVHDDVVDDSDRRRNIPTVNATHGYKTATFFGDIILAKATILLTSINNAEVISIVSKILDDLVKGELIQMESGSDESRLFSEYLAKCYKKTGSLFSNSLKAVSSEQWMNCCWNIEIFPLFQAAVLANCSELCVKNVYQFGRNFGLMFQLVDDLLDFCSVDSTTLGKPSRVDLQLGIVTAPVLFAAGQKLEIVKMIRRKFSRPTDVSRCMELVLNESDGIFRTRQLIEQFADQALRCLNDFPNCQLKLALQQLCKDCATRKA
ncbi:Decaprenyl-diphosphate synthase subunit 1 [Trichinella sp. T6]|nr:Decaprenyl-diphosphate synthase subunit 1 [Trichinella sp. T6]